jgi:hypothetical protein
VKSSLHAIIHRLSKPDPCKFVHRFCSTIIKNSSSLPMLSANNNCYFKIQNTKNLFIIYFLHTCVLSELWVERMRNIQFKHNNHKSSENVSFVVYEKRVFGFLSHQVEIRPSGCVPFDALRRSIVWWPSMAHSFAGVWTSRLGRLEHTDWMWHFSLRAGSLVLATFRIPIPEGKTFSRIPQSKSLSYWLAYINKLTEQINHVITSISKQLID